MIVNIPPQDMSRCRQAATGRWQLARMSGVGNQRRDNNRSDNDIDFLGVRAEYSVAKVFGLEYSPTALGIDDGADMWSDDVSIDVKSTFHTNGRMLFKSVDAFKASVCVLVSATPIESQMDVRGWAARSDFAAMSQTDDLGHGLCRVLENDKLRDLSVLWQFLVERKVK